MYVLIYVVVTWVGAYTYKICEGRVNQRNQKYRPDPRVGGVLNRSGTFEALGWRLHLVGKLPLTAG